jgi:hypothetical protein
MPVGQRPGDWRFSRPGIAWRVPHSAFRDSTARATQPRHSIEFRTIAYFE